MALESWKSASSQNQSQTCALGYGASGSKNGNKKTIGHESDMKVVLARKEKAGKNRRVVGRTIGENKPRNDVMKDRRPDVMTLQDGGPDVYQDVGQEVTSSKMGGGGENLA